MFLNKMFIKMFAQLSNKQLSGSLKMIRTGIIETNKAKCCGKEQIILLNEQLKKLFANDKNG